MQTLQTYKDAQTFLVTCVGELLEGYEFKMTDVLDSSRRCVHHVNRGALHQLERAFRGFKDVEQWHQKQGKTQAEGGEHD